MRRTAMLSLIVLVAVVLTGVPAHAQEQTLARSYAVTPMDGMTSQFESALKAHVSWRAENNDPWTWGVSTVEVGDALGEYRIRSGGHSWADFDAYDAEFGLAALVHWNATVAPLVQSISSTISMSDPALSIPAPAGTPLAFVNVVVFHIRPDRQEDFNELVRSATTILQEHDYGGYSLWTSPISGGGPGPVMSLVSLHTSWADMAEPDPTFPAIMIGELGEDGFAEWLEEIGQTYRGTESYTLRLRPDLGINQN